MSEFGIFNYYPFGWGCICMTAAAPSHETTHLEEREETLQMLDEVS